MTPEQISNIILALVALLASGIGGGAFVRVTQPKQPDYQGQLAAANNRIIGMVDKIASLETTIINQIKTIAEITAYQKLIDLERNRERARNEAKNDALMIEQGRRDNIIEGLQKAIGDLRSELKQANDRIIQLEQELKRERAELPKASNQ